jgi:hypothetical protein
VQRSGGRAHQDRALFEWNFVRELKHAALRHDDEFRVAAIAMFSNHLRRRTKLFGAGLAKDASPAGDEVMHANAIAGGKALCCGADLFHHACNLMPEREWQRPDGRDSGAVMRIGMANPGGLDANQHIARSDDGQLDLSLFKRRSDCDESNCFHAPRIAGLPELNEIFSRQLLYQPLQLEP